MSARREKRKRADPRRRSFFDGDEKTPSSKRRLSTRRDSEIFVTKEDDFRFKSKKDKAKKLEARVAKEAGKDKKEKKTQKLPVPHYPTTEVGPEGWENDSKNAPPAIQRFFEHVLDQECNAISGAFQGPFGFVSTALGTVCEQFLQHVEKEANNVTVADPKPSVTKNHAMELLRKKEKLWTGFLESADKELAQWAEVSTKCKAQASEDKKGETQEDKKEGEKEDEKQDDSWKDFLSEEDRSFLEGCASGGLAKASHHTCAFMAIKRDCILKNLRVLSARVDACDKYARRAGREVNAAALRPFGGLDPKAFIMD